MMLRPVGTTQGRRRWSGMKFLRALSPYEAHHRLGRALLVIGAIGGIGVVLLFAVKAVG